VMFSGVVTLSLNYELPHVNPLPRGDFIDLWVGDGNTNCKHEYSPLSHPRYELLHQPYLVQT
jgi:hypothetical protein